MITGRRRLLSGLLAIIMVAGMFTIFPLTTKAAAEESVVTWSGETLLNTFSMRDGETHQLTGSDSANGISVNYVGGQTLSDSGFYANYESSTDSNTKILRLNNSDSELTFTSESGNRFITKIVIEFDKYFTISGATSDTTQDHIVVNHGVWTNADVISNGMHTLTLEGNAARSVTIRKNSDTYHYGIRGITSVRFYLTEDLYTAPTLESGFYVYELEDGGVKIVHGNPARPLAGSPFIVRSGGKIAGFSQADADDTTSYTIANPIKAFTFELDDGSDTITVDNIDDFMLALGLARYNTICLSADLTFDGGFTITRSVSIDLKGHSLTCDSSATDKTIRVTGGNPVVTSTGYYWYDIVNSDISGFDKIEVTGGSLTIKGGRYDLPEGFSGNVRLTGGLYKLNDAVDMNKLESIAVNHLPEEIEGGWAKLNFHVHDYNTVFETLSDGGIHYINRCDGCDHTVKEWTLTNEEINTLIELNGGAFTPVTNWNPNSPGSVTLYLRITEDTYNTAIAAPYNMNADALKMLRDNGILGSWETHGAWTTCSTENGGYHSDDVDITFVDDGYRYVGVDEPMTVTSKNGKDIYRAVIHLDEYYKERTNQTYVNRGNAIISDDALTVTVTNINSKSFTFNFSGLSYEFVPVESVELCYAGSGQNISYVTVNTTPDADDCYGHTMNYDYRDHTYTLHFTSTNPHHTLQGEPDWNLTDDGINFGMTATTHCTVCGEEIGLGVESYSSGTNAATYTREKTKLWHFLAQTDQYYYYDYLQVIGPKLPVTTHSIEDGNGNILEYYEDESTGKYYIDLDGPAIALDQIRIPETKIDAVPAADEADGNIEYYTCSNGRYFKLEDGKYIEIAENAWISHIGESEVIDVTMHRGALVFTGQNAKVTADSIGDWYESYKGIRLFGSAAHVIGLNGKKIKAIEVTRSKVASYASHIYINVGGEYDHDYTLIGDSGDVFMYGNLSASEVAVYGDFNYITSVKVWYYDDSMIVNYTKVGAIDPTPTATGNIEYYIGPDGRYYVRDGARYVRIAENSWIIPKVVLTKFEATEAAESTAGNTEYYAGDNGKFYVKNGDDYDEITYNSWIIPALDGSTFETIVIHTEWDPKTLFSGENADVSCDIPTFDEICVDGQENRNLYVNAKYGKTFYKVVFHISSLEGNSVYAKTDKGAIEVSDDGRTVTVWNFSSDSLMLSNEMAFYVSSLDVYYTGRPGQVLTYVNEQINLNDYRSDYSGIYANVNASNCNPSGANVQTYENGDESGKITITGKNGQIIDKVVFHVTDNQDRSEYAKVDRGLISISDDRSTITVTNINANSVTLSTNFCEDDHLWDPEEWEDLQWDTYFQVSSVDVGFWVENPVTFTRVPATAPTISSAGNSEYYIGSNGSFYVKNGDKYAEIAEGSWVIPAITLTKVNAVAPTPNAAGNSEYYVGSDGKYYAWNEDDYVEIENHSWLLPKVSVILVEATPSTENSEGNTEYYIGNDGKFYVLEGNTYVEIAENSWIIPILDPADQLTYTEDTTIEGPLEIDRAVMNIADGVTVTVNGGIVITGNLTVTGTGALIVKAANGTNGAEGENGTDGGNAVTGSITVNGATVKAVGGKGGNGGNGVDGEYKYGDDGNDPNGTNGGSAGNGGMAFSGSVTYASGAIFAYGGKAGKAGNGGDGAFIYRWDETENDWMVDDFGADGSNGASGTNGAAFATDVTFNAAQYEMVGGADKESAAQTSSAQGYLYVKIASPGSTVEEPGVGEEQGLTGELRAALLTADTVNAMNAVTDMPANFKQIDLKTAKTWTVDENADPNRATRLIYAISGSSVKYVEFYQGNFQHSSTAELNMVKDYTGWGEQFYYVIDGPDPTYVTASPLLSAGDTMPANFVQVDLDTAASWTGVSGQRVNLIYAADGEDYLLAVYDDGNYVYDNRIPKEYLSREMEDGEKFFYVTGTTTEVPSSVNTITWLNDDGTLIDTTEVETGVVPTHADPTKASDSQYNYIFTGWSPEVTAATSDATYTATYTAVKKLTIAQGQYIRLGTYNGVPVVWYCQRINGTGTFMLCEYALKASKFGSNATYKTSNIHAWLDLNSGGTFATDLGLTPAELSLVRTVNLSSTGGDGTDSFIIPAYDNNELNKGQSVRAPYNINTSNLVSIYWLRTARDTSNARVVNHSKDGSPVATVAARYSGVGNSQWIRPMFYLDTTALQKLAYTGTGTKDDPYVFEPKYELDGFVHNGEGGTITATVSRDNNVIYDGPIPTQTVAGAVVELTATPETGYSFRDIRVWDDDGNPIMLSNNSFIMPDKPVTVIAEFEKQTFTVTWQNDDGAILDIYRDVEYGVTPNYEGPTPEKAADAQYTYAFAGWTPEIAAVTADVTYTATYIPVAVFMGAAADSSKTRADIYFSIPDDADPTEFTLRINGEAISLADLTKTENGYRYSLTVPAKNMGDMIAYELIHDGETVKSGAVSIAEYAEKLAAFYPDEYGKFVDAMLAYGAAAQNYFGYDTEHLVSDADLINDLAEVVEVRGFDPDEIKADMNADEAIPVIYTAMNVTFLADTTLSLAFRIKDGFDDVDAKTWVEDNVTLGGEPVTARVVENGKYHFVIISKKNVAIDKIGDPLELVINGAGTYNVSVLDYIIAAEQTENDNLKYLTRALYAYSKAASNLNV